MLHVLSFFLIEGCNSKTQDIQDISQFFSSMQPAPYGALLPKNAEILQQESLICLLKYWKNENFLGKSFL